MTQDNKAPIFLTINEAMEVGKIGRTKLYALLADGSLRARKSGRRTLIEAESLSRWASSLPVATFGKAA